MNVCDIMTARPTTILAGASIATALDLMRSLGCHHLPVLSDRQHLIGVISFHDVQRALGDPLRGQLQAAAADQAARLNVAGAMTPAPIIVEPDAPAHLAAHLMLEHFIGCLPVMRGETLVGIITRSDLLMAFMTLSQSPLP